MGEPRVHQAQPLPFASPALEWASGPPAPFFLGHVWVVRSWTRDQTHSPSAGSLNPTLTWTARKSQAPLQTFPGGQATLPPSTGSNTPRRQLPPIRDLRGQTFFSRSTFKPTCCRANFCFPETLMAMMLVPINIQGEGSRRIPGSRSLMLLTRAPQQPLPAESDHQAASLRLRRGRSPPWGCRGAW